MTQQVIVAIISKEMCLAVTDKSGLPIAGFLRNIFQYSLYKIFKLVQHLNNFGEYKKILSKYLKLEISK